MANELGAAEELSTFLGGPVWVDEARRMQNTKAGPYDEYFAEKEGIAQTQHFPSRFHEFSRAQYLGRL